MLLYGSQHSVHAGIVTGGAGLLVELRECLQVTLKLGVVMTTEQLTEHLTVLLYVGEAYNSTSRIECHTIASYRMHLLLEITT